MLLYRVETEDLEGLTVLGFRPSLGLVFYSGSFSILLSGLGSGVPDFSEPSVPV